MLLLASVQWGICEWGNIIYSCNCTFIVNCDCEVQKDYTLGNKIHQKFCKIGSIDLKEAKTRLKRLTRKQYEKGVESSVLNIGNSDQIDASISFRDNSDSDLEFGSSISKSLSTSLKRMEPTSSNDLWQFWCAR